VGNIFQKPGHDGKNKEQQTERAADDKSIEQTGDAALEQSDMYKWVYTNRIKSEKLYYSCELYSDKETTYIVGFGDCAIFIIEPESGKLIWKHELKKNLLFSGPGIIHKDIIYAVTRSGVLQALSIDRKAMLWEKNINAPVKFSPAAGGNLVYVSTHKDSRSPDSGKVLAFSLEDGSQQWEKEIFCATPIIYKKNRIYLKSSDGFIYALTSEQGETLWKHSCVTPQSQLHMSADDNNIFVGENEHIYSIATDNGSVIWRYTAQSEVCPDIVYNDKSVFIMTFDGFIHALDCQKGILIWKYQLAVLKSSFEDFCIKPSIYDKDLVISRYDYLYILGVDNGKLKWNKALNNKSAIVVPEPVIMSGYTVFSDGLRSVNIVHIRKMKTLWICDIDKSQGTIVAIKRKDRILYVMSSLGSVFFINLEKVLTSAEKQPPPAEIFLDAVPAKSSSISKEDEADKKTDVFETAEEPVAPQVTAEEPVAPQVNAEEPVAPQVTAEEPVAPQVNAEEPVAPQVTAEEPVAPQVTAEEPVAPQVTAEEPVAPQVTAEEPVAPQVTAEEPVAPQVTAEEPVAPQVTAEEPVAPQVTAEEPVAPQVTAEEPVAPQVTAEEPVAPQVTAVETIEELPDELPAMEIEKVVPPAQKTQQIVVDVADVDDIDRLLDEVEQEIWGTDISSESKETAPATASETAPATASETAPATASETAPATASETAPDTAPDTAPATAPETAPATAPETAPEFIPEVPQEAAQEMPQISLQILEESEAEKETLDLLESELTKKKAAESIVIGQPEVAELQTSVRQEGTGIIPQERQEPAAPSKCMDVSAEIISMMEKNFKEVKEELSAVKSIKAALEEKTALLITRVEELQNAVNEQKEDLVLRGRQLEILYDILDKLSREIAEPGRQTLQTGREITQSQVEIINKHLSHIFKYLQVFSNELAGMKTMVKPVLEKLKSEISSDQATADNKPANNSPQDDRQAGSN